VPLTAKITALDDDGRGTFTHDSLQIHVPFAVPGDLVTVEIEHASPHRPDAWARLVSVGRPSPNRTPPVCPATGQCGGCALGMLSYSAQLAFKNQRVARLFPDARPIVASKPTQYRNFSKLVYGDGLLGAYAPRSHDLVDLAGCNVNEPILETMRAHILEALRAANVAPYDERKKTGLLSYVTLRANHRGEVLATLVGTDLDALAAIPIPAHPALIGVAGNLRPEGNAIFGSTTRSLRGALELEERVGDVDLLLSPTAFFQVNRDIAARIYADLANELAGDLGGVIVDAYAGIGGIALTLAKRGANVTAIEVNTAATADGRRAAERARLTARFIADDAAAGLRAQSHVETLTVNPPRRGLDEAMRDAIAAVTPRTLAYVSCDPDTLARDLTALAMQGLHPTRVQPYDMHPQTPHIETLVVLRKR
jgi:23S rRNA (uracil1939-C5)-methyltransferase